MNSNPTATLWVFAYNGLTAGTHISVIKEMADWPNLSHWCATGDSLISRARSRVASSYLQETTMHLGDVLLMVDHDISWQAGDLSNIARRALEHNAIVGGIYPKRAFNQGYPLRLAGDGQYTIGEDKMIPAVYVSSGFMAIPRLILRRLSEDLPLVWSPDMTYWPFFTPMIVETTHNGEVRTEELSEDWALCERARAAGFKVLASAYPRLTHEGQHTFRLVDAAISPPKDRDITIDLGRREPVPA